MNEAQQIPREAADVRKGAEVRQRVSAGGGVVTEISRATAPIGRTHGYIARQLSEYATAGCTCGWWSDGLAEGVIYEFEKHVEHHS